MTDDIWPADTNLYQPPTIPPIPPKQMRQLLIDAQVKQDAIEAGILLAHGLTVAQAVAIMQASAPAPLFESDLNQDGTLNPNAQFILESLRRGRQR